jgi:hypothetical protein
MDFLIRARVLFSILLPFVIAHPGPNFHRGADHSYQPSQDGGVPFTGLEMLSTPGGSGHNTPSLATITRTSRVTKQSQGSRPTGPTIYISAGTSSTGPIPISVILVAVATMCPLGVHPTSAIVSNTSVGLSPAL